MGAKVKVWSLAKPTQPTLSLVLDHSDPVAKQQQQAGAAAPAGGSAATPSSPAPPDVNATGTSNMRWLIKSELAESRGQGGKPRASTLPDIVAEVIAHAAEDVPEVMQVGAALTAS